MHGTGRHFATANVPVGCHIIFVFIHWVYSLASSLLRISFIYSFICMLWATQFNLVMIWALYSRGTLVRATESPSQCVIGVGGAVEPIRPRRGTPSLMWQTLLLPPSPVEAPIRNCGEGAWIYFGISELC